MTRRTIFPEPKVSLGVRVPRRLRVASGIVAQAQGMSLTALVEGLLGAYVAEHGHAALLTCRKTLEGGHQRDKGEPQEKDAGDAVGRDADQ